jgi:hypothetical protein
MEQNRIIHAEPNEEDGVIDQERPDDLPVVCVKRIVACLLEAIAGTVVLLRENDVLRRVEVPMHVQHLRQISVAGDTSEKLQDSVDATGVELNRATHKPWLAGSKFGHSGAFEHGVVVRGDNTSAPEADKRLMEPVVRGPGWGETPLEIGVVSVVVPVDLPGGGTDGGGLFQHRPVIQFNLRRELVSQFLDEFGPKWITDSTTTPGTNHQNRSSHLKQTNKVRASCHFVDRSRFGFDRT